MLHIYANIVFRLLFSVEKHEKDNGNMNRLDSKTEVDIFGPSSSALSTVSTPCPLCTYLHKTKNLTGG